MLRRAVLLMVLFAMSSFSVYADEVTAADALQKAQAFANSHFARKGGAPKSKPASQIKAIGQVSGLFVFGMSDAGGFVIVSNDDRTTPILGYSDNGTIDPNNMPDGLRYMLDGYKEQIALLGDTEEPNRANRALAGSDVRPLITTNWGQSKPYNNFCPQIDGDRTVTGCVATTMAQLLYYHYLKGFSATSTAIPGYSFTATNKAEEDVNVNVAGLSATSFNWSAMTTTYTSSSTGESANAVAKLMQYAGTALEMHYGLKSSEAYSEDIPYALKTYFGFDGGIQHCYRKNYSYDTWISLIYGELAANRPVALGGQSCNGGHSFICDGYKYEKEDDYFHINWGWGGSSDGYFLLSLLNPYEEGVLGLSSSDGFSYSQDAVIGIQPPVDDNPDYCLSLEGLHLGGSDEKLSSKTFTRDEESGAFTGISLYYLVYNYNRGGSHEFDTTVQLVDDGGNVKQTFGGANNQTRSWNGYIAGTLSELSIPSDVVDGTYFIKVMSRPSGEANWQECYDGDAYKLTATISGNDLTISVPIPANTIPSATISSITGDNMTGHEHTATATITGGTGPYNGNVYLRVNGTNVVGKTINIGASEIIEVKFPFIPTLHGDNTVALCREGGTPISSVEKVSASFVIDNSKKNFYIIKANDGKTVNATLYGRKLYKDGNWNTICLPFELTIAGSPLEGAEARTLIGSDFSNGSLTLNFSNEPVATLEAGKPYIIRWNKAVDYVDDNEHNIVNPVFNSVTIDKTYRDVTTTYVDFLSVYNYMNVYEDNHSVLFVGANNKLFWPQNESYLGACRAYFKLKGLTAGDVAGARMNFDESTPTIIGHTEITEITEKADASWYTIDGVRLSGKPTQKGLYIYKGIKRVVK